MNSIDNKPSKVRVLGNLIISVCIFTLFTSCTKEWPEYEANVLPIRIGEYQIQENSELEDLDYDMVLHWIPDQGLGSLEFCNFHNRQVSVSARYNKDGSISIPMQDYVSGFEEFQIYQGSGSFTPEGFNLMFWGNINGIEITSSLIAKYNE